MIWNSKDGKREMKFWSKRSENILNNDLSVAGFSVSTANTIEWNVKSVICRAFICVRDRNWFSRRISEPDALHLRNTKKYGANGINRGLYFPLGGNRIQGKVRSDGFHQMAKGDGRCISEDKDLAEIFFDNQCFTVRNSAYSHWNDNSDRNIEIPYRRLLIYTEIIGGYAAINILNLMNIV